MIKRIEGCNPTFSKVPPSSKKNIGDNLSKAGRFIGNALGETFISSFVSSGVVAPRPGRTLLAAIIAAVAVVCGKNSDPKTDSNEDSKSGKSE